MKELVDFLPKSIKFNSASDDLKEECFNFLKSFELQGKSQLTIVEYSRTISHFITFLENYLGHQIKLVDIKNLDFLKNIGFNSNQIGLHGISLGASTSIFAAYFEPEILAIWSDSSLAEFNMILKDEIARYGLTIEFGPAVSFAGKILTGIDQ